MTLPRSRDVAARRARLVATCSAMPEVDVSGNPHLAFRVRKKTFAYYLFDHHGDGRIALCCKAAPGEMSRLVEDDPRRFFVPCYLGARGWISLRLDLPRVNWAEVSYLVRTAYRLCAPRSLSARVR